MNRAEILEKLQAHKQTLVEWFGVTELALFGSFARDQATDGSDVDILVSFDGPATSRTYFGVQFYIEDLLGRPVNLVTEKALRPEFRPYVDGRWYLFEMWLGVCDHCITSRIPNVGRAPLVEFSVSPSLMSLAPFGRALPPWTDGSAHHLAARRRTVA